MLDNPLQTPLIDTLQHSYSILNLEPASSETHCQQAIKNQIQELERIIDQQLSEILHAQRLQRLEGSWRGISYLLSQTERSDTIKYQLLDMTKDELQQDLNVISLSKTFCHKTIYDAGFNTPGGYPISILLADYYFSHDSRDVETLRALGELAEKSFSPLISAASPSLLSMDQWQDLDTPYEHSYLFKSTEYQQWNSLRSNNCSKFITLTLPRVLARTPYQRSTQIIDEKIDGNSESFCWMNAAYCMATCISRAFHSYGWTTAIRGSEGGGKVNNLPFYHFNNDQGLSDLQCPTEVGITDYKEAELSQLGLLPLCHYKNTDYAVFFGAQTLHLAETYTNYKANANARISSRLPYILATSRFAHYLNNYGQRQNRKLHGIIRL